MAGTASSQLLLLLLPLLVHRLPSLCALVPHQLIAPRLEKCLPVPAHYEQGRLAGEVPAPGVGQEKRPGGIANFLGPIFGSWLRIEFDHLEAGSTS